MTDGTISRATINNNWTRPTGDLKGCFASLWTNAGGRIRASVLALRSGYDLPTVGAMDYQGLFPQALVDYPDSSLPVEIGLRAFSPLIPQDLKSSSIPVAIFVFTLKNVSHAPVEASVAFSWENFLGVGGTSTAGTFADRTGNTVSILPAASGLFGVRMTSSDRQITDPPHRYYYNARGSYALMAQALSPDTQVTAAGWNVLDVQPAWWKGFAQTGTVSGTVAPGNEGTVHPAGVVALKVALRDKETRDIPFAIAWYTPRLYTAEGTEYGHYYQKSFDDAAAVARYALDNRLSLGALTDEWQRRLQRSTLPPWLISRLINDTSSVFTNTVLTRDSGAAGTQPGPALFSVLEDPSQSNALGAMDLRLFAHALYAAWFPELDVQELHQFAGIQTASGAIPRLDGRLDLGLSNLQGAETEAGGASTLAASCAFVFQVEHYFRWTGDQAFLDRFYPAAKHALESTEGVIRAEGVRPALESDSNAILRESMLLGALKIGEQMAAAMQDKRFATQCADRFAQVQQQFLAGLQTESAVTRSPLHPFPDLRHRPCDTRAALALAARASLAPSPPLLIGAWMAEVIEAGDALPPEVLAKSLNGDVDQAPDPAAGTGGQEPIPLRIAEAALHALRGRADRGLAVMKGIDYRLVEGAHSPWQYPAFLPHGILAEGIVPFSGGPTITSPASWFYLAAVEGFSLDVPAGRLTIAPRLPAAWRGLEAPVFAPTFWGWLEYRPGRNRTTLVIRFDRFLPAGVSSTAAARTSGTSAKTDIGTASLVLRQVVLPAIDTPQVRVEASLGRAPLPGKTMHDVRGRLVFTFDAPVSLSAGQRLEFVVR